jgi:hypothetical protein
MLLFIFLPGLPFIKIIELAESADRASYKEKNK